MRFLTSAAVAITALATTALAHNMQLPAHGRECFHEELHKDDKMTVTFQVGDREFGSAGNLDIDFWITNPQGNYETYQKAVSNGDYSFDAKSDGKFVYCFGNEGWGANTKEVSFNVHGIVYVAEHEMDRDPLEAEGKSNLSQSVSSEGDVGTHPEILMTNDIILAHIVRHLAELISSVKDEQSYIVVRERTHRNTAESTNSRVKWWNIFVIGLVVGESLFQVWWLRRFFEVKRVL